MTPPGGGGSARVPEPAAREGDAGAWAAVAGEGAGGAGGSGGQRRREGHGETAGDLAEAGELPWVAVRLARGFCGWGGWK